MIELLLEAERALSVGLLDRAEKLYAQVAAADPRNSIAVVGLSRVALDRGDERRALELAREALALDLENVAAERMVARLEEVIEYRGEPLPPAREVAADVPMPAPPIESAEPATPSPTTTPSPGASSAPSSGPAKPRPTSRSGLISRMLRRVR
jgi:hypothetical protein